MEHLLDRWRVNSLVVTPVDNWIRWRPKAHQLALEDARGRIGRNRTVAFVYPQRHAAYGGKKKRSRHDHEAFLVSVDEIETRTGLDFLTDLPDEVESDLESELAEALWP